MEYTKGDQEEKRTMAKEQRTFTKEFKMEAVRLAETSGKPITELARELGVLRCVPSIIGANNSRRMEIRPFLAVDTKQRKKKSCVASNVSWKA
jgi:transposase-like protein